MHLFAAFLAVWCMTVKVLGSDVSVLTVQLWGWLTVGLDEAGQDEEDL